MIKNALTSTNVTRETLSRREFLAGSAAVGATIMTRALPAAAQEKTMKKTFTILHTNDMHSAFIGLGPAADYTPFKLGLAMQRRNEDRPLKAA